MAHRIAQLMGGEGGGTGHGYAPGVKASAFSDPIGRAHKEHRKSSVRRYRPAHGPRLKRWQPAEPGEVIGRLCIRISNGIDAGEGRPATGPGDQGFHGLRRADEECFHASIGAIAYPSPNGAPRSLKRQGVAVPDALDATPDLEMAGDHCKNGLSTHHADAMRAAAAMLSCSGEPGSATRTGDRNKGEWLMRLGLIVVAVVALIGFVVIAFVLPQKEGNEVKEAAQALVSGAEAAQKQVSAAAEKGGSLGGAGKDVKLAARNDVKHGELKWLVSESGAIRGWNERNAIEVTFTPSLQGGKVSWACRGYPISAMPQQCGGR